MSIQAGTGALDLLIPARMLFRLAQAAIMLAAMELIVVGMVQSHRGRGFCMFTGRASLGGWRCRSRC